MAKKVNFEDLFASSRLFENTLTQGGALDPVGFSDKMGYHIYGELRLNLTLSASEDTKAAAEYLKIIQAFAAVAHACGSVVGARILEIQGERIHLHMPVILSEQNTDNLLSFCTTLSDIVCEKIAPLAGAAWNGFAMAVDHGRAILLRDSQGASGSIISLGCCANAPAKQLRPSRTSAGYLSVRSKFVRHLELGDPKLDWYFLDLRNAPEAIKPLQAAFQKTPLYEAVKQEFKGSQFQNEVEVRLASTQFFEKNLESKISAPVKIQGFYFRADLDGFSAQVESAFASGDTAISALIERFIHLMKYAEVFAAGLGRPSVKLPWAGDCANLVILPRQNEAYHDAQRTAPAAVAAKWHDQKKTFSLTAEKRWSDLMGKGEWVVGCAGGDSKDGSNGYLLVAPILAGREFLVAAGWGARRSLDAQDVDGNQGGDTVIPKVDFQKLDSLYQKFFAVVNGSPSYYRSKQLTEKLFLDASKDKQESGVVKTAAASIVLPKPKPYHPGYDF